MWPAEPMQSIQFLPPHSIILLENASGSRKIWIMTTKGLRGNDLGGGLVSLGLLRTSSLHLLYEFSSTQGA